MSKNEIRNAIGKATNYNFASLEIADILENAIKSCDKNYQDINDDDVWDMVEDCFIYYANMWKLAQYFNATPFEITYEELALEVNTLLTLVIEELK